jgi:hypothetical protein
VAQKWSKINGMEGFKRFRKWSKINGMEGFKWFRKWSKVGWNGRV